MTDVAADMPHVTNPPVRIHRVGRGPGRAKGSIER